MMAKKKPAPKVIPIKKNGQPENAGDVVDELGRLEKRIRDFKKTKDRYDELRAKILSWYQGKPAGKSFVEDTERDSQIRREG